MSDEQETGTVAGVFPDEESAADAIQALLAANFDARHDLSVIVSHRREHERIPVLDEPEVIPNAKFGAALGAVLGAAGAAFAGLSFGPLTLVAAGPVLAALEAGYAGGAMGFALGALRGLEIWNEEADFHAAHIHDGVVWVGVRAKGERAERARRVLSDAGAKHFMG